MSGKVAVFFRQFFKFRISQLRIKIKNAIKKGKEKKTDRYDRVKRLYMLCSIFHWNDDVGMRHVIVVANEIRKWWFNYIMKCINAH